MTNEKLKPCPFCGGAADVTDLGVTSFIIDRDGAIIGEIMCGSCATSVTYADCCDESRARETDHGSKRLHPMDLWKVANATMAKWNMRVNDAN